MTPPPSAGSAGRPTGPDFIFSPRLQPLEARIVGLYRQLETSQWWPAETLRRWQFAEVAGLVAQARQHVPFYSERLGALWPTAGGVIDEDTWRTLPILTKQEVRTEAERLKSRVLPPGSRVYSEWTTGSSGVPLEVQKTKAADSLFRAIKLRMLRWHGYDPAGKVCEIRRKYWKAEEDVLRLAAWEWPFGTLFPTGEQVTMGISSEIEAQVHFLETEAPDYLLTYPSNLRLLLRAFRRTGKRLPTLRLVRTMSERLDPDLRRECQETLGVPLVDCYGCVEGGFLAIQCPEHAHYHVQSEMNFVEVLREDGVPCQPGETGRVVITPLHSLAMPLLRYELGDYAEVGEPCPCGRGLPVLRQIYGRKKEVLTLPSGERRYPFLASPVFESLGVVSQYQVVQKSTTLLEVRIVAERPLEKAESEQIVERLARQVGPEFEIRLVFVDDIPRLPGGKYMDFVSEVSSSTTDGASAGRAGMPDSAFSSRLGPMEAQVLGHYRQLESSQWWPAEQLRQWQFAQLGRLVAQARQHVPFYAEKLAPLFPAGAESGTIDERTWRALPILTKEEVRAEFERLKNRALPPAIATYSEWTTGSTGIPLEVIKTGDFKLLFLAIKLRLYCWHGYDPTGKLCEIRRPFWKTGEAVHRFPRWEWPFGAIFRTAQAHTGEQVTMSLYSEPEAQMRFLEAEAPAYLTTLPSNLRLLLRAFQRAGKRLPTLRLVRTYTERVDPELRRECQETLGVPLVDTYGCEEAGFIALTCPGHDHYHVQGETNLVEILRDDGEPCQPGEIGRVVITPLHALAMPLLRYELGDYAEVGEPCPCGRGLPVLRRIHGRKRESLTLPSGERRYSTLMAPVFEGLRAVIQYQVVQKSLKLLEVRIVAERPLEKTELDQIVNRLSKQVGPEFEIRLVFMNSIPRLPGGKYMDFFSELESGGQ